MSDIKPPRPKLAKGKVQKAYVLPEELVVAIGHRAVTEKTRASYLVERLLRDALEADAAPIAGAKTRRRQTANA